MIPMVNEQSQLQMSISPKMTGKKYVSEKPLTLSIFH